jgi:hypothetical protein
MLEDVRDVGAALEPLHEAAGCAERAWMTCEGWQGVEQAFEAGTSRIHGLGTSRTEDGARRQPDRGRLASRDCSDDAEQRIALGWTSCEADCKEPAACRESEIGNRAQGARANTARM